MAGGQYMMQDSYAGAGSYGVASGAGAGINPSVAGAGIQAGGSWISQYMAQRAAEEAQRRKIMMDSARTQGGMEQDAISSWLAAMGGALRGGR